MCGRSSISQKESDLEKRFNAKFASKVVDTFNRLPIFNVCPTTFVPTISNQNPTQFAAFHWGLDLIGYDGKLHKNTINARKENIKQIPLFHESLAHKRCIIPATSYFEWKQLNSGKTKIPYLIKLKSIEIFSLAALYTTQPNEKGEEVYKFVLITQPPTENLLFVHDRMPAILTPETENDWLNPNIGIDAAYKLIALPPKEDIIFYPVTTELNRSFDNNPNFIKQASHQIEEQGSLF